MQSSFESLKSSTLLDSRYGYRLDPYQRVPFNSFIYLKRWKPQVAPKPNTFFPFGTGIHACPGNELAKLEILVLIHHLVTNYRYVVHHPFSNPIGLVRTACIAANPVELRCRWEIMGQQDGEVEYCPFPVPKQGLVVKLLRVSNSSRAEQ